MEIKLNKKQKNWVKKMSKPWRKRIEASEKLYQNKKYV